MNYTQQLNEALNNYYTISETSLPHDEAMRLHDLLKKQEMTTQDFAYFLRHLTAGDSLGPHAPNNLRGYAEIVLDWEPMTMSIHEWLIYLLSTLDEHITQLTKLTKLNKT